MISKWAELQKVCNEEKGKVLRSYASHARHSVSLLGFNSLKQVLTINDCVCMCVCFGGWIGGSLQKIANILCNQPAAIWTDGKQWGQITSVHNKINDVMHFVVIQIFLFIWTISTCLSTDRFHEERCYSLGVTKAWRIIVSITDWKDS